MNVMVCFANKSRSREIIGCLPGFTHTGEVQTLLPGVAHDVAQIQKQGFAKISDDLDNALKGIGKPPIRFKDHYNDAVFVYHTDSAFFMYMGPKSFISL